MLMEIGLITLILVVLHLMSTLQHNEQGDTDHI